MDEAEILIAILVGLYKLVRLLLVTIFRGVRGVFSVGRRAFRPRVDDRAAPARMMKAAPARRAAAPRAPAPRPLAAPPLARPSLVPPPIPPPSVSAPASDRVVDAYAQSDRSDSWLSPELVRDAILLDSLLTRRR